jgi:hypothetical protein
MTVPREAEKSQSEEKLAGCFTAILFTIITCPLGLPLETSSGLFEIVTKLSVHFLIVFHSQEAG